MNITRESLGDFDSVTRREWLVSNGIGGFASSTIVCANTRRYHGLLIASLHPPVGRTVMVAKLDAVATLGGQRYDLASDEFADGAISRGFVHLDSFGLEGQIPVWRWLLGSAVLEQRLWMSHGENVTYVQFTLVRGDDPVQLELVPLCTHRDYHSQHRGSRTVHVDPLVDGMRIRYDDAQPYRILAEQGSIDLSSDWHWNFRHRRESERGLDDLEDLFRPGIVRFEIAPGESRAVVLTAEFHDPMPAHASLARERARLADLQPAGGAPDWIRQLTLAADQFVVQRRAPVAAVNSGRRTADGGKGGNAASDLQPTAYDQRKSHADSLQPSVAPSGATLIAGYPWFGDWGRDTMIALPGLTLTTGRFDIAASILRTFASFVSEGMLPNRFPDGGEAPEYNTVDATLWYFVAVDEYVRRTNDRDLLDELYPVLRSIVRWHQRGTRYGIGVDSQDGLLRAGQAGVQLTWMDAKIGDWVVTPRIGKPVEINALWFNALMIMRDFAVRLEDHDAAREYHSAAERVARNFAERFWFDAGAYLHDVIDGPAGDDASLRPNQLFAVSLRHALLDNGRARSIVEICERELWTPLGLRSLARGNPSYAGRYVGGPGERDAVYHQGTVWLWLLGPFVAAHYRVHQDAVRARSFLDGIPAHLRDACIGQVSEIADGDPPFMPRGCLAQAWSVAEILRAWHDLETSETQHEDRSKKRTRTAALRK